MGIPVTVQSCVCLLIYERLQLDLEHVVYAGGRVSPNPDGIPKPLAFVSPFYPNPQPGATPNFFVRKEIEDRVPDPDGGRRSNQGCPPARL